jgi:hypothetical protein
MSTHCSLHDNVSWSIITIIVIVNIFVSQKQRAHTIMWVLS